jgi:glucan biosynthesis protein C
MQLHSSWYYSKILLPEKNGGDHVFVRKHWLFTAFITIALPAVCASLFLQANDWFIMLSNHLMPSIPLLLFYSLWYFIGWFLWENQTLLPRLGAHAIQKILISIVLYIIYLICYFHFIRAQNEWLHLLAVYIYSLSLSMAIFGLIGAAWRYLPAHQAVLRYLSKVSYWLYLTQVPVIWYLSWIMVSVTTNFYIQFFSIILLCFAFSLLTYHLFIRRTRLQKILG